MRPINGFYHFRDRIMEIQGSPRGENKETTEMIISSWRQDETFPFAHRSEPPAETAGRQQGHMTQSQETAGACDKSWPLGLPDLWSC